MAVQTHGPFIAKPGGGSYRDGEGACGDGGTRRGSDGFPGGNRPGDLRARRGFEPFQPSKPRRRRRARGGRTGYPAGGPADGRRAGRRRDDAPPEVRHSAAGKADGGGGGLGAGSFRPSPGFRWGSWAPARVRPVPVRRGRAGVGRPGRRVAQGAGPIWRWRACRS